jgi:hypothetical protein
MLFIPAPAMIRAGDRHDDGQQATAKLVTNLK